jgi:hypothetical protein
MPPERTYTRRTGISGNRVTCPVHKYMSKLFTKMVSTEKAYQQKVSKIHNNAYFLVIFVHIVI